MIVKINSDLLFYVIKTTSLVKKRLIKLYYNDKHRYFCSVKGFN